MEDKCGERLDSATYKGALVRHGAVGVEELVGTLATTCTPLALIDPMLIAMTSVTYNVYATAELRLWPCVSHSFASRRRLCSFSSAAPSSHPVVTGYCASGSTSVGSDVRGTAFDVAELPGSDAQREQLQRPST
ncbi:hypothetical protein CGC21_5160 [Leishmania donovani]|uniref:Uncharacterized protein n=1 Tax=Leishmania donovani TaxID=5661 RepID=A0A504XCT5_LEIDO|nr:hypothetical protein CGC21_5160 [Leishmania donovani]